MNEFDEALAEEYGLPISDKEDKPETKEKKEDGIVYTSYVEVDDYILEQINPTARTALTARPPAPLYIRYHKNSRLNDTTDTAVSVEKYETKEVTYYPISNELYNKGIVKLPSGVEPYISTEVLITEIQSFLDKYFEAPPFFQRFLPYMILFYWVYDKFPFIPYLHFMGRTGTGKSTAMEVVGSISYKTIDVSGSITMASIFRTATDWKGTLMLDEFLPGGDTYKDMLSLLKSGVSDRAVLRVEGEKKKEVTPYLIKSPKMFTSEKPVTDAGLRSRVIEIKMNKNKRRVPLYRTGDFGDEALHLRNKLLAWRLDNLNSIDLSKILYGFEELQAFEGRVQQVITPIYYLADEDARKEIQEFAAEQQEETLKERLESLHGQVFEIIVGLLSEGRRPTLSEIIEILNPKLKYEITEKKLGLIVRKELGYEIERVGANKISTIVDDEDKTRELLAYYGIDTTLIPYPSHPGGRAVSAVRAVVEPSDVPFD